MNAQLAKVLQIANFPHKFLWQCVSKDQNHTCRADKPDCLLQLLSGPTTNDILTACRPYIRYIAPQSIAGVGDWWTVEDMEGVIFGDAFFDAALTRLWLAKNKKTQ